MEKDNGMDDLFSDIPEDAFPENDGVYKRPKGVKTWIVSCCDKLLKLVYSPFKGAKFIDNNVADGHECELGMRIFRVKSEDVEDVGNPDIESRTIILGSVTDEYPSYYRIPGRILGIVHDVYIDKGSGVEIGWFFPIKVNVKLSVFQKIDPLIREDIFIGGEHERAIPLKYWQYLLYNLPGRCEIEHYVEARMQQLFSEYLPSIKDGDSALKKYLEKWPKGGLRKRVNVDFDCIREYDRKKFKYIYDQLACMLDNENAYERDWEDVIVKFICVLFPRYIRSVRQGLIYFPI